MQQNDKDMSIASLNLRVTELDGKSCAIDEDILSLQRDLCQMHSVTENLMQVPSGNFLLLYVFVVYIQS